MWFEIILVFIQFKFKGARAPAPLRSDAKVPLRSGLCDMNDIVDDKNQYRRSLYAE